VIELTLDAPVEPGTFIPRPCPIPDDLSEFGSVVSEEATLELSSGSQHDHSEDHARLFSGERSPRGYAFCAGPEENPWVKIDLGSVKTVKAVIMENRPDERCTEGLTLSVSTDGEAWAAAWEAEEWEERWFAVLNHFQAGIDVPGRPARYLKLETRGERRRLLLLQRVIVYGE
jgi:hypothetical protein